ncbi:MAG: hypothetical protein MZV64_23870 [Ignavibacteriales bacterium]|nr:hypothetical protein [Ignavibacteriales bacterium]
MRLAPQPKPSCQPATFTILHTNDFHGQLELSGSNPGHGAHRASTSTTCAPPSARPTSCLVDAGDDHAGQPALEP